MKKFLAVLLFFTLFLVHALPAAADPVPALSSRDRQLLARVIAAECPDGTDFGVRIALAALVLNRIADGRFGDTAAQVIWGDGLFVSVQTGRVLHSPARETLACSLAAVDFAVSGMDPASGALWFGSSEKGGTVTGGQIRFASAGWWFW